MPGNYGKGVWALLVLSGALRDELEYGAAEEGLYSYLRGRRSERF